VSSDQRLTALASHEAESGHALFSSGNLSGADEKFQSAIRLNPQAAEFHLAAGVCNLAMGRSDDAGDHFLAAVRLSPNFASANAWLGEWYLTRGAIDLALKSTARAMELDPTKPECLLSRAWVLEAAGETNAAWDLVQQLLTKDRLTPSTARLYGRLAPRFGREEHALQMISGLLQAGTTPDEYTLNFAAADLLERAGRYDEAFLYASRGNEVRRAKYDPVAQERWASRQIAYFTRERLRSLPRATDRSDKPVFIVGMPRSGTSLAEQIVASHPAVHGAGELNFIQQIFIGTLSALSAQMSDYPACLDRITLEQVDDMADIYQASITALNPGATRITDKMPMNFMFLGQISLLLPGARIIHCRRDPMDTCLSCFMTPFRAGQEFKHDLTDLGNFYRLYERLMAHWKASLDLSILDVDYEDVVSDLERQSRRMTDFLGLPWDDRCLRFHNTKRAVLTASVQQVRRPIYKSSVQRWRRYESHLGPLKAALRQS